MGCVNIKVLIRYFFSCLNKMRVFDVLHHLVTYLWTKRYKCCIKSANYVMLTNVRCLVGLLNRGTFHVILIHLLFPLWMCFNLNVCFLSHMLYQFLTGGSYFADMVLPLIEYIAIFHSPLTPFRFPPECINKQIAVSKSIVVLLTDWLDFNLIRGHRSA